MITNKSIWLLALLLVAVVFISGCVSQQEKSAQNQSTPETNISNVSESTLNQTPAEPKSELVTISAGEVAKDSFGNEYAIRAFGDDGIDLTFNSKEIYVGMDYMACEDGKVKIYGAEEYCSYVGNVKIYLKAFDRYTRKATLEVAKI
jgi:hypothetical protein